MKKISTLIAAAALTVSAMAAPATKFNASEMTPSITPEFKAYASSLLRANTADVSIAQSGKQLQKSWTDSQNQTVWNMKLSLQGPVGDLYTFTDPNGQESHPSIEEFPYYGVLIQLTREESETVQRMSTIFCLWWPSMYEWKELVDAVADGTWSKDMPINYACPTLDQLANEHENELYPDYGYCSKFTEVPLAQLPGVVWDEDANGYLNSPTAMTWGMDWVDGVIGNAPCTSGMAAGNPTIIEFNEYVPGDQWVDASVRLFVNGTNRNQFTFSGTARVQGWTKSAIKYPEIGQVHIFNTGVDGSAIQGDTNIYGVTWGPLQRYWVMGLGKYFQFNETLWEGAYDRSKIQLLMNDDAVIADGVNPYDAENYFFGSLFLEEGKEIGDGTWEILEPYRVGTTNTYTVKPVADCMVPYYMGDTSNPDAGWVGVNGGISDIYSYPCSVKIGTTVGFNAVMNNGFDEYVMTFDKDLIVHYDEKNMALTKTIKSVGDSEPLNSAVAEIEAGNEAPVYFNLQGVRVANPEKGLFIKVEGNKSSKVIL